jgi:hypothetical protein
LTNFRLLPVVWGLAVWFKYYDECQEGQVLNKEGNSKIAKAFN